jgi:hypothetical protein
MRNNAGRKPKEEEQAYSQQAYTSFTKEQKKSLQQMSDTTGVSIAALIRKAVFSSYEFSR